MKIMLTGSNGLVGQKIKEKLLENRAAELIVTSLSKEVNPLDKHYTFETLDITKEEKITNILKKYKPDVLINCAAEASANKCEKEKAICKKINTEAVRSLVEKCNQYNTHLIQISTDFVFKGTKEEYNEDDLMDPVNYYGITKKEAEETISKTSNKWSIIRPVLVYGFFPGMKKNNIVTWVLNSLSSNKPIKVVNDQYRCPTLAEDLADAIIKVATKKKTGIFNISGEELFSILELAQTTAEHFNLDKKLITGVSTYELKEPALRPTRTRFNLNKAKQELRFHPRSFSEGLKFIERQVSKK